MLAGEDITCPAHIGSKLVNFAKAPIQDLPTEIGIAQIPDRKVVSLSFDKGIEFQIDAADPESLSFQPLDQMASDEAASPKNNCQFLTHRILLAMSASFFCSAILSNP